MNKSSLFLATALVTALGAGSAVAQTSNAPATTSGNTSASSNNTGTSASNSTSGARFWTQDNGNEWRTSKMKGLSVYNNNNEKLGNIDDILVDQSGQIKAVIIGVGGFLGIGEHNVAVGFDQLKFVHDTNRNVAGVNNGNGNNNTNNNAAASNAARTNGANPSTTNAANTGLGSPAGTGVGNNANTATSTGTTNNAVAANNNRDNDPDRAILNATKDQLKNAPQFKYRG